MRRISESPKAIRKQAVVLAGAAVAALFGTSAKAAVTYTTSSTASGNWSLTTNWLGGVPADGVGNIALLGTGGVTLTLDSARTLGTVNDGQGSARNWTINASGSIAMTMDNTGATVNNPAGDLNAYIGESSSGALTFNPNIIISNTDLDIANTGSTTPVLTIGVLNTSTITATTTQNLFIKQNQATSTKAININSSIGSTGSVITIQNSGTGGGATLMNLNGIVGPNANIVQNSANSALVLNALNTYTGTTTVTLGQLRLGLANAIPSGSNVSVTGTLNLVNFSDTINGLSGGGVVNATSGTPTLTLGNLGGGGNFSGTITNTGGTLAVTKVGPGTQTFSGANSFGGKLTVLAGTLAIPSINDAGSSGPLGNSSTSVTLGNTTGVTGTLEYTGTDSTPTSSKPFTAASNGTAAFQVDTPGTDLILNGLIDGGGGVVKSGGGNLTFSGPVAYTGNTTVTGGTLFLGSGVSSLSSPRIIVGTGATLDVTNAPSSTLGLTSSQTLTGTGAVAGTIAAASGATLLPGNAAASTSAGSGFLTIDNLTLSAGAKINLGLDATNAANNYINATTLDVSGLGGGSINLNLFAPNTNTSFAAAGTYDLFQYTNLIGTPVFNLTATPGLSATFNSGVVVGGNTFITLTLSASSASRNWVGPTSNSNWSTLGNWQGNQIPQTSRDTAVFGTSGTPGNVTLDTNETVAGVTFNNSGGSYAITGANTLTIDGAGQGGSLKSVAGSHSIGTSISLNDNVSVTVASGAQLTLSGNITSTGTSQTLKFDGAGTAVLSGSNSYGPTAGTVGTSIGGGGTVQLGSNSALSAGDVAVTSAASLRAGAAAVSVGNNITLSPGATLTVDNNGNAITFSGNITEIGASGAVTIVGNGAATFGGVNTYSGATTLSGGVLNAAGNSALGSSTVITSGLVMNPASGTAVANFTSPTPAIGALSSSGAGATSVVLGNATAGASTTLTVGGSNSSTSFGGVISDNSGTNPAAIGQLTKVGTGALTLSDANSYTGLTTVLNGTLIASNNASLGSNPSLSTAGLLLNPDTGLAAAVNFTSSAPSIASLASSGAGASSVVLGNLSANTPTTLTVGGNNAATTYAGSISDVATTVAIGNLVVNTTGGLTLSGANPFHGSTTIAAGAKLIVANTNALQNSAVDYTNGLIQFTGVTSAIFGNFQGTNAGQNLVLTNDSNAGVSLTVGGNGATKTFSGLVSGNGSLTKTGAGQLTLASATYTGNTTINGGSLTINNAAIGSPTAVITAGVTTNPALTVTSGTVTAGELDIGLQGGQTGAGVTLSGSTSASFGIVKMGSSSNTAGNLTINTTGNVSLGHYEMGKDGGVGLSIQNGTVTAASVDSNGNSSTAARVQTVTISGGAFTIGDSVDTGSFQIGGGAAGFGNLTQTGGQLTYLGPDGLILLPGSSNGSPSGNYSVIGANAVASLTGITLNSQNSGSATSLLTVGSNSVVGTTLYLGNVGLVINSPGTNVKATFSNATVGALADWSTPNNAPITLAGLTTFKAADSLGNPHNISLSGVLSGTGSLGKTGGGKLTLSGANSYSGTTSIDSGGTLIVNGTHTGGGAYTVNGALGGAGTISAAVTVNANGHLVPGDTNTIGTLNVGTLAIASTALDFESGSAGVDKIVSNATSFTATGSNVFNFSDLGGTTPGRYVLIDYGGTPLTDLSAFNASSVTSVGGLSASIVNNAFNTSIDLFIPNTSAINATYALGGDANWDDGSSWSGNNAPNGLDHTATFGNSIGSANATVTLNSQQTVAFVNFNNSLGGTYKLDGGNTLVLDASGGYVGINVNSGNATINVPVQLNKDAVFSINSAASSLSVTNSINGSKSLTKSGPGLLILTQGNNYDGSTTIGGGTISVSDNSNLGDNSSNNTLIFEGGALHATNSFDLNGRAIQLFGTGTINTSGNTVQVDSNISGAGGLVKDGAGSLNLNSSNSYSGPTTIAAGIIAANDSTHLGDASSTNTLIFNGGELLLNGGITSPASRKVNLNGTGGTIDTNGNDGTIAGVVSGAGGLTKLGNGHLFLTGSNTFSGAVSVAAGGTIDANSSAALGDASATNTLILTDSALQGAAAILSPITRSAQLNGGGGSFDTTSSTGTNVTISWAGQITGSGALNKVGNGTLILTGNNTYTGGTTIGSGTLIASKLTGGPISISGGNGVFITAKTTPINPTGTSVTTSLNITGASMDITNNALITKTANTSSAAILNYVKNNQLVSSSKGTDFAIGYGDNAVLGKTTFGGVTVDATNTLVALVYKGDANLDGRVNALDFNALATNFGVTSTGVWIQGDFNNDGNVDTNDFTALGQEFNKSLATAPAPPPGALVPEPVSIGLLGFAGISLMRRKRREAK